MTKKKVSVDDIIGIVKTDETNSVTLKKEVQLSICEKRLIELEKENEQLKHDATVLIQANQDYRKENEQLKNLCKTLIKHIEKKSIAFIIDDEVRELLE